jgi:hypothetical protein
LFGGWPGAFLAQRMSGEIATVLPDRAERYFSTALMWKMTA